MTITVGENSYISIEQATDYHGIRGNTEWTDATIDKQESALIQATEWIDSIGRGKWKGKRATQEQLLAWPRVGVTDEDGFTIQSDVIPSVVVSSTAEAALRVVRGVVLSPDLDRGGKVQSTSVGNGAVSITYMPDAPAETNFSAIEKMLSGVVNGSLFGDSGGVFVIPMVRA